MKKQKILLNDNLIIKKDIKIENIVEINGFIYIYKNTKLDVPNLKESSYIYISNNGKLYAPKLKKSIGINVFENGKLYAPLLGYNDKI